jgi:hypothetical protein
MDTRCILIFAAFLKLAFTPPVPHLFTPSTEQDPTRVDKGELAIDHDAKESLKLGDQTLFLTRRTDLEEELIGLQYILKPPTIKPGERVPVRCIEIMDIKLEGFKIKDNFVTASAVDLDDSQTWRAAYDCTGGRIFHLYGFQDDDSGINNLIKVLGLRPSSESDALVLASDLVRLTYRDSTDAVVRDGLTLMAASLRDYQGPRNLKAFERYWSRCPAAVIRQLAAPYAASVRDGYTVLLFTYVEKVLTKTKIKINGDGTTSVIESTKLFAWTD